MNKQKRVSQIEEAKKKHNCLWIMSLQKGVLLIVVLDFLSLIALIAGTVIVYLMEMKRQRENKIEGEAVNTSGILYFSFITDGIITLLFLTKCYYGAKFAKDVISPPKRKKKYEDAE
jgi:hypothetical protein